jgi:hypothetical protein
MPSFFYKFIAYTFDLIKKQLLVAWQLFQKDFNFGFNKEKGWIWKFTPFFALKL